MVSKLYLLLFAIAISSLSAFAQCGGELRLFTQADVDAFASRGCTVFDGNVNILGWNNGDIANVDSLYRLERITGALTIDGNEFLTNLHGLHNLKTVDVGISMSENSLLTSLDGFDSLESTGQFSMWDGVLTDISALGSLRTCGPMVIKGQNLTSLNGLQNLTSMARLVLSSNEQLSDLSALSGPRTIGVSLELYQNHSLTSLSGMEDVHFSDTTDIQIIASSLTSLAGLPAADSLGSVSLSDNPQLSDISALASLRKLDGLQLLNMPMITSLDAFSQITSIGYISIQNNVALTGLHGLHNITSISSFISIARQPFADLSGLENVVSIGHLNITDNANLTSLNGLQSIQYITGAPSVPDTSALTLSLNPVLKDISALNRVTSLGGTLKIEQCDALKDLHGLEGITSVGGGLAFIQNKSLETLSALSNVTSVGIGYLLSGPTLSRLSFLVSRNTVLKDLGIRQVQSMPASLRIIFNQALENVNDLGSLEQVGLNQPQDIDVVIVGNAALQNVDSLSSLRSIAGNSEATKNLTVTENPMLNRFCGLYTVISEAPEDLRITIESNGTSTTPEQIVADGPCSGDSTPHPGQLTFTDVTDNTMTVSFAPDSTAPSGGYLLVMRANNSPYPEDIPTDGSEYHVGQVIGSSTIVVGKGTGNEFHIVYLSPSTTYHFALFSFDSQLNYETANPVLGSQATLDPSTGAITQPTNLVFSDVTDNSMTISFTASTNENVDGYITVMRAYSSSYPEDIPVDGTAYHVGNVIGSSSIVVGMGPATSLSIVYLNPDTEYWFDVYSYTSDGGYHYMTTGPLEAMQQTSPATAANAYPNPFVESVTIGFTVSKDNTPVRVTIYDNMGTPVAELLNATMDRGKHEVLWNGIDSRGNKTRSGLYHYTILGHENPITGTLVAK
jgi:hypothetical protein